MADFPIERIVKRTKCGRSFSLTLRIDFSDTKVSSITSIKCLNCGHTWDEPIEGRLANVEK